MYYIIIFTESSCSTSKILKYINLTTVRCKFDDELMDQENCMGGGDSTKF